MKQPNKIAILGGTGKAGKYLIKELIKQGFYFKMLVRNAASRPANNFPTNNQKIEIIEGDANDYEAICSLIDDCNAVISTLGNSQATAHLIRAMNECGISRYILLAGININTPFDKKGTKTQFATNWMYENYPIPTKNRQAEYELVATSNLDWTMVRLPLIEQTDTRNTVKTSLEDCEGDKISASDLAVFLIEQLSDESFVRQTPFLWSL